MAIESSCPSPLLTSRPWEQKEQAERKDMILGGDTMEGLQPDSREERQASELLSRGLISQRCSSGFCNWWECHTLNSSGPQGGPLAVKWRSMIGLQEPKARRKEHGRLFPSSPFGSSIPSSLVSPCRRSLTGSQLSYRALVCGFPRHRVTKPNTEHGRWGWNECSVPGPGWDQTQMC